MELGLHPGPISALASFTGPIEVRLREEQVSSSTLEIVHRPLEGVGGTSSRALESVLDEVFKSVLNLSSVPRSLCQIVVQSLSPVPSTVPVSTAEGKPTWPPAEFPETSPKMPSGAASRAAAINAVTLASLHAGSIGLRAMPCAVSLVKLGGEWVVDPTTEEEEKASARFAFAWAFGTGISAKKEEMRDEELEGEIVWTGAEGAFSRAEVSGPTGYTGQGRS